MTLAGRGKTNVVNNSRGKTFSFWKLGNLHLGNVTVDLSCRHNNVLLQPKGAIPGK